MAKRRTPKTVQPAEKSVVIRDLPSNPDVKKDEIGIIGFGLDPVDRYNRESDLFVRRDILWKLYRRCTATGAIAFSVASEIASQEIFITPTQSNPSATTLLRAKQAIDLINNAMNRPGGIIDFIINVIDGYWGSKTGAFILTPRDARNNILFIGIVPPTLPRPYYEGTVPFTPTISAQPTSIADGIWFSETSMMGGNYYTLLADNYYQACYGALGFGAFQDGTPPAELQLSNIVAHIAISDYSRRNVLCVDESQLIHLQNIDAGVLIKRSNEKKEIAVKKRNGLPINIEDEGARLFVTEKDPDRPSDIKVVNLRAFPEGFDPEKAMAQYEERIAIGFGVNPRRAAPEVQRERFGNATQAAMLNSDEPGLRGAKNVFTTFLTSVLLDGLPLRAEFQSRNSPENYWIIQRDNLAAQTIQQMGTAVTDDQKRMYLERNGVLTPSETGQVSLRTGDGVPMSQGWVSLRDRIGHILTYEAASEMTIPTQIKATTPVDTSIENNPCFQEIIARWNEWIVNELPTVVDNNQISYFGLQSEVDDIAQELFHDLVQCAKAKGARSNDMRVRQIFDAAKIQFLALFASPNAKLIGASIPQNNLFNALWGKAGAIYTGAATVGTLQTIAASYEVDLKRYANAMRAAVYMAEGMKNLDKPVTWILGHVENHCNLCPQFARSYPSFRDMLTHTSGLLPGDIRLPCSGNCKCHLEFAS